MSRILFIVGGALGHVGRVASVVQVLEETRPDVELEFVHRDPLNGPWVIDERHPRSSISPAVPFDDVADAVEAAIAAAAPDVIVTDLTPVQLLLGVRWPAIPRVYLTNYFLTGITDAWTRQLEQMEEKVDRWNEARARRWLPPVRSVADLYQADHLVYCDPIGLAPAHLSPTETAVGPVSWEPRIPVPPELDDDRRLVLATFGSTGRRPGDFAAVEAVRVATGADTVVWAGAAPDGELPAGHEVYEQLPLSPLLRRCEAAIVHAGAGSTYAALLAGVPVVLVPKSINHGVLADELEAAGVGVRLSALDGLDAASARSVIDGARERLRETEIGTDGPTRAAELILDLLEQPVTAQLPTRLRLAATPLDEPEVADLPLADSLGTSARPLPFPDGSIPSIWVPDGARLGPDRLPDLARVVGKTGHVAIEFDTSGTGFASSEQLLGADLPLRVAQIRPTLRRRYSRLPEPIRALVAQKVPGAAKSVGVALVAHDADPSVDRVAVAGLDEAAHHERAVRRRRRPGRVVLHIGTHKTGTTSLQRYCALVSRDLDRLGVRYFADKRWGERNAASLPLVAVRPELQMRLRRRLHESTGEAVQREMVHDVRSFISNTPARRTVLMSHEGLSFIRSTEEIERLEPMLDGREVTIVVTTREPASFLASYGAGLARSKELPGTPDPTLADVSPDSWLVDYEALIGVWRDAFGADNVVHANYEAELAAHGSTVPRVLRECGLTLDQLPTGWRRHQNVRR